MLWIEEFSLGGGLVVDMGVFWSGGMVWCRVTRLLLVWFVN